MSYRTPLHAFLIVLTAVSSTLVADDDDAKKKSDKTSEKKEIKADDKMIGYFLGVSVGQQFRQHGFRAEDVNFDSVKTGIQDGMADKESNLSDDELKATQMAIQSLLQKRQQKRMDEMQAKAKVENEKNKAAGIKFLAENAKKKGVKELEKGIQYKVLKKGDGDSPLLTDTVTVHYTGKFIDGEVFDSSVQRGEPATFPVDGVIQGWTLALQKMKVGDKWMLYIPQEMAYGPRGKGNIKPFTALTFEVELLGIR